MKLGILVYKTGKSFTKGESRLQNRNPIYKKGTLRYKRDSRLTIYLRPSFLLEKIISQKKNVKYT